MGDDRGWMYRRRVDGTRVVTQEFLKGLDGFIEVALKQTECRDGDKIRCPCRKCDNLRYKDSEEVRRDLIHNGFILYYQTWRFHGERVIQRPIINMNVNTDQQTSRPYHTMVTDHAGPYYNNEELPRTEEPPNADAKKIYDLLRAADKKVWSGSKQHSQLSSVVRLMSMKAENHVSERFYNQLTTFIKELLPEDNLIPDDYYNTKKLLRGMGLPVEKIDCCPKYCMIYWGDDSQLDICKFCNLSRYKDSNRACGSRRKKDVPALQMHYFPLTPRLQRLYASQTTAESMRWHATSSDDGIMRHPADSPAWKHVNTEFPSFASEIRNVRLGLSTDGFAPFDQTGRKYSSWPVIVTPYNLPPWLCMKAQFMFLTVLVPGPSNPKMQLDVFLQPLIQELNNLWEVGVRTYDVSLKQNFQMRAVLLWTISDFPAYAMLSGWSTAGKLACPHCMEDTEAFTLKISGKQSWFDNHRKFLPLDHPWRKNKNAFTKNKLCKAHPPETKSGEDLLNLIEGLGLVKVTDDFDGTNDRVSKDSFVGWKKKSIFWDLPYWKKLLLRHNLDVMHVEKNVFDNVFNTVLNVAGKTKDTKKSREELNTICKRPELMVNEKGEYPKACYTLDRNEKKALLQWVQNLRFPDGYASNLTRCPDMNQLKMSNMKSHDCHVFMQLLLPIAFRELMPQHVWKSITELSLFFKQLGSREIKLDDMCALHEKIPEILCKLERIFPPSFFDSMEHLPVHLADEARLAGPVQYRWMYPFERYLRTLKNNVKNKARVEGSISNAYVMEEASTFCSYYFEDNVTTRLRNVTRNDDGRADDSGDLDKISIFQIEGRTLGRKSSRYLETKENTAAHLYILSNCSEVAETYLKLFNDEIRAADPLISVAELDKKFDVEFASWFKQYVKRPSSNVVNKYIKSLAEGPLLGVDTYSGYFINGYRFHTTDHELNKKTMNSGVCIKGSINDTDAQDFYGRLKEVCVLEYPGYPKKTVTLFRCEWFDTSTSGIDVHPDYKLVSVNHTRRYKNYEPFVLANQVTQVSYCSYPSLNQAKKNWWGVCKVKARSNVELPAEISAPKSTLDEPFQEDNVGRMMMDNHTTIVDDTSRVVHPSDGTVEVDGGNGEAHDYVFSSDEENSQDEDE